MEIIPVRNSKHTTKNVAATFTQLAQFKQQKHISYRNFTGQKLKLWK